jgi:hypothetical protein
MVVSDPAQALELTATGRHVVLIVPEGSPHLDVRWPGPGRLAALVGAADDPQVLLAAAEMDQELFGGP